MEIQPHVAAIVITGVALTVLVMPKNRQTGYLIFALTSAYAMLQLLDPGAIAVSVPNVAVAGDPAAIVPVAIVTGLLILIAIVIGGERDDKPKK